MGGRGAAELAAGDANVQPRERFTETAYWNPLVQTGKDGTARVSFKAPTALSSYRITVRGVRVLTRWPDRRPRRSPSARTSSSSSSCPRRSRRGISRGSSPASITRAWPVNSPCD